MKRSLNTLYCSKCGGTHVQIPAWVDANTSDFCSRVYSDNYGQCGECEDYVELCTLKELWDRFADIPINNNDEIEEGFLCFDAGDYRFDVWHWFDERCPNGLAVDLIGETPKDKDAL